MINFPKTIKYQHWFDCSEVIAEAVAISTSTRDSTRSTEKIFEDALNGLALQYSVADELMQLGYEVLLAPDSDKSFDFDVIDLNKTYHLDTKGMFNTKAKTFRQSIWENRNAHEDTLYVCYDCRGEWAEYSGWCTTDAFILSKLQPPHFIIYPNSLNK